jgi:cytochrome c553
MKRLVIAMVLLAFGFSARATAQTAADNYKSKCQMCHAADGSGNTPMGKKLNVKDFHSPDIQKLSDDELFQKIRDGVTENGKLVMPAYKGKLSDDSIRDLVKYVRELGKK